MNPVTCCLRNSIKKKPSLSRSAVQTLRLTEFNELLTARRATLEVSGGVGGNRFTDTLAIEQMGNEPMIVANPDTVRIDAAGGTVDIEVLSTVEKYNVNAGGWVKNGTERRGNR